MRAGGERSGLAFGALCALNGAFVPAVTKLTTDRADPLFVAVVVTLFAACAGAIVLLQRGEFTALFRRHQAGPLALVALLGTALPYLLFFEGTARTSAIVAVLCLQIEPLYALLLSWGVLGHRLTGRRLFAAGVLLAGIVLAVGREGTHGDAWGVAALLATPLCWQLSHLVALRRLVGVKPRVLTGARFVYGGLLLAPVLAWAGAEVIPAGPELRAQLPVLAFQGFILTYMGTMLWYQTITRLDLGRATSIVVPSIPVLSLAASFVLVGEVPTARQGAGMALAVAGVMAFVLAPHAVERRERIPTATAPIAVAGDPEQGGDQA